MMRTADRYRLRVEELRQEMRQVWEELTLAQRVKAVSLLERMEMLVEQIEQQERQQTS